MWKITSASAQGLTYFHEGRNNQDVASVWTNSFVAAGIINDGCHGLLKLNLKSEVGAHLSNLFLIRRSRAMLLEGVKPSLIPSLLFPEYIDYLWWQVESQFLSDNDEKLDFISLYLMCTTIGILADESEIVYFWAGDGLSYLNDSVHKVLNPESLNRPRYPAYHLYESYGEVGAEIQSLLPNGFETEILSADSVRVAGVSSDGLSSYPHLMDELNAYSNSNFSLQMCLNRISTIRSDTKDNVSVIFLKRLEV